MHQASRVTDSWANTLQVDSFKSNLWYLAVRTPSGACVPRHNEHTKTQFLEQDLRVLKTSWLYSFLSNFPLSLFLPHSIHWHSQRSFNWDLEPSPFSYFQSFIVGSHPSFKQYFTSESKSWPFLLLSSLKHGMIINSTCKTPNFSRSLFLSQTHRGSLWGGNNYNTTSNIIYIYGISLTLATI